MVLIEYGDLRYPQYDRRFKKLYRPTWEEVQKLAQETLDTHAADGSTRLHPNVKKRCGDIVAGIVPCGLVLEKEEEE